MDTSVGDRRKLILTRDRLTEILHRCKAKRVAVIGDFCLDAYWYADMTKSELSRETPRFPLPIVKEVYSPGGAGNVALNLTALGLRTVLGITVFGLDWRGELLRKALLDQGICLDFSLSLPGKVTPAYIKPMLQGYASIQEDSRLDFGPVPLSKEDEEALLKSIGDCIPEADVIAIADQVTPGVITPNVRAMLTELSRRYPEKLFVVDSRKNVGDFSNMIVKPNELEALKACGMGSNTADIPTMRQAAARLHERTSKPVFVTLGENGALLIEDSIFYLLPGVAVEPPVDIVGAGDTFLSALCASLAGGASPWEAGMIANLASSVTVKKLNTTGTASPEEILARYDSIRSEWKAEVWDEPHVR